MYIEPLGPDNAKLYGDDPTVTQRWIADIDEILIHLRLATEQRFESY